MMKEDSPCQPVNDIAPGNNADRKKNDDDEGQPPSGKHKTLEEKAKEFYAYVIEAAKNTDKRTILLAKQRLEAKAKEFFRYVATYMREKAKPDILLVKQKMETKAMAFVNWVLALANKVNKENMLLCKKSMELGAREMIFMAVKTLKSTNYRRVMKEGFRDGNVSKLGRLGLAMLSMLMMVTFAFHTNGGKEAEDVLLVSGVGVRGRVLANMDHLPTPKTFEAAEHSLHPKWRLWGDIPGDQREAALEGLVPYFQKYGHSLGKPQIPNERVCQFLPRTANEVCMFPTSDDCNFMSIGVSGEAKFETSLANNLKCKGFAVVPTEMKQPPFDPSISFHRIGVPRLHEPEGETPKKHLWNTTLPALRKFLKEEYTDVLRLDCEGCEIALMRDILLEDPAFFHHFGQVSVKKHAAQAYVNSDEDLYYFGLMFPLLEEAGFTLVSSKLTGCRAKYEKGCMSEFNEWSYYCGTGSDGQEKSRSCQTFLFAREEIAYQTLPASENLAS